MDTFRTVFIEIFILALFISYLFVDCIFFLFVTFKMYHPYEFIKCIYVLIDIGDKHLFIQYDVLSSFYNQCISCVLYMYNMYYIKLKTSFLSNCNNNIFKLCYILA